MIDRAPTAEDARDLLAAEYVLGLTEPADLPQVEAFILRDTAFAALVAAWRARLSSLDFTADAVEPDPRLWADVETALGGPPPLSQAVEEPPSPRTEMEPSVAPTPPVEPRPSQPRAVAQEEAQPSGLWRSLTFWRGLGLAALAAALLLGAGLGYFLQEARRQPTLIAVLMPPNGGRAAAIVRAFATGRAEIEPLQPVDVPPGKAIQIWTLPDVATAPKSVGVIDRASRATLKLEGLPATRPGQMFQMTIEDAGGSPTGAPTGPLLGKGEAAQAL
ncbi:MAG: hypothetical protein BGP06_03110 [Rhizobiales bacterium 65-9]|nr:anti-sigma factor [Hyphomicrobiales bacterium]OJY35848.1 MAG: hypothetical protein BGP06_03110 [Rhizobiales bacterium 65-9]